MKEETIKTNKEFSIMLGYFNRAPMRGIKNEGGIVTKEIYSEWIYMKTGSYDELWARIMFQW